MQNTFGTFVAIGIVTSGFMLTGDLGWCLRQGARAFDRAQSTTRSEPACEPPASEPPAPEPAAPKPAAPIPSAAAVRRPPSDGPARLDLAALPSGQRVVVWTAGATRTPQCHVIHMLDPATGEAMLQSGGARIDPAVAAGGREGPHGGDGPARRVMIAAGPRPAVTAGGASGCTLVRGGAFSVKPIGLAHGTSGAIETFGPILAMATE